MINSVEFVPVHQMSVRDWTILDYSFLRNTAKNRIADLIVSGELTGFFRVNVFMKAATKPYYYWPVTAVMEEEIDPDNPDDWDFFGNEAEEDFETDAVFRIEEMIAELQFMQRQELRRLLAMILVSVSANEQILEEEKPDYVFSIEDLQEAVESNPRLRPYEYLLVCIYIYRVLGIDAYQEYIDSLTSEETEELFNEIRGL